MGTKLGKKEIMPRIFDASYSSRTTEKATRNVIFRVVSSARLRTVFETGEWKITGDQLYLSSNGFLGDPSTLRPLAAFGGYPYADQNFFGFNVLGITRTKLTRDYVVNHDFTFFTKYPSLLKYIGTVVFEK